MKIANDGGHSVAAYDHGGGQVVLVIGAADSGTAIVLTREQTLEIASRLSAALLAGTSLATAELILSEPGNVAP